jgi:thiol-disulfide isomerase/thioredoxin
MKKKTITILFPLIFLACNFVTGRQNVPASPAPASVQPASPQPEVYSTTTFTISRIKKMDGDLLTQLAAEAQKAKALHQEPFIEFDATWCPPCQAIDKSIKSGDPMTLKAFEGVYLIRADVDDWGWGDGRNFKVEAIPVYFKLDGQGLPTGESVDGAAWNEDIPENFAPVLDRFFHAN